MVAAGGADPYSPFHPQIVHEDGPQSSEEGSGLHSPVFGAPQYHPGDSFRYPQDQLDVHHPATMIAPQYDYGHGLAHHQQPPMLDTQLELPNPASARSAHVQYSSQFLPNRNQLGLDFPVQSPVTPRVPPPHVAPPMDYRYSSPSERRLPGGPSHDHSYARPTSSGIPIEGDQRSPVVATPSRPDASPTQPQPSTSTQESRKEISNVVIACRQCRGRKIRCDSTRPVCNNCVRRNNDCEYDEKPKRRGPDKRPGTRQRSCKKRPADGSAPPPPKRKKTSSERPSETHEQPPSPPKLKENSVEAKHPSPTTRPHLDRYPTDYHYPHLHQQQHSSQVPPSPTDLRIPDPNVHYKHELSPTYRRTSYMYDQDPHRKFHTPTSPSVEDQKNWWDRLLRSYPLTVIYDELNFLLHNTGHLLSFINLDLSMKRLYSDERLQIQPAFIYAVLAMSKLMKSSKLEGGQLALSQVTELANLAHTTYKDALEVNWVTANLCEAAFILALFESSAHPHYSPSRQRNALISLDNLIRTLNLTTVDHADRDVCSWPPSSVPVIIDDTYQKDFKCQCAPTDPLDQRDPSNINRSYPLPWISGWTPAESQDESIRRLCWSSLSIISEYVAQCETFNEDVPRFFIADPSVFALLFPAEVIDRVSPTYRGRSSVSPKESIYALYCRSMLLWNFCNRFRVPSQEEERAEQAHEAFLEAQSIEDALNTHTCNLDTTLIYTCREYIHNTRMLVTQAFRSFHGLSNGRSTPGPIFKRKQAEDWLFYEDQVIQRLNQLTHQLHGPEGHQLTRRPFRVTWLINQLAICLVLWNHDPTLDDALRLAKTILNPIDVLNELWPCPAIRARCAHLRNQLSEACNSRRMEGPLPENYSLPAILRTGRD